jgi:2-C-methyl-D-erythritol 4-phosphate cytidylyltransferase
MDSIAVIIPAAGRSVRFGSGRSKLLEPLRGEPVIRHAVRAFLSRGDISGIIIAAPSEDFSRLGEACSFPLSLRERAGARAEGKAPPISPHPNPLPVGEGENGSSPSQNRLRFCVGGACRAESVLNALRQVPLQIEWVAIHDAARPLVSQVLIDRALGAAKSHGAAVPALPVALTIKQATGPLPARVERTVPRQSLWAMQTPQVMRRADLLAAFENCPLPLEQITDDAQLLELCGGEVWLVEGEERNLKITTQSDLLIAGLLLGPE